MRITWNLKENIQNVTKLMSIVTKDSCFYEYTGTHLLVHIWYIDGRHVKSSSVQAGSLTQLLHDLHHHSLEI